jgi:hypothetical protein
MGSKVLYSAQSYRSFVSKKPSLKELRETYPEVWEKAVEDLVKVYARGGIDSVHDAVGSAQAAHERIAKSGMNPQVLSWAFPLILKTRMVVLALQNHYVAMQTGATGKIRFNLWNGFLLQRLLFSGPGFVRKPIFLPTYCLAWLLVTQKSYLMPLLYKQGIYCFYTRALVRALARLMEGAECLEIGAGDGTLTRFLAAAGVKIRATDDHSWSHYIRYPDFVEKLDARAALEKYRPEAVICSWPPPRNNFERHVFDAPRVRMYVAIGSPYAYASGDRGAYEQNERFQMIEDARLARLLLPRELKHAVYVFTRTGPDRA